MINNSMQWRRTKSGNLELFVGEINEKGYLIWKHYKQSRINKPDLTIPNSSKGLESFREGLKRGYTILKT